MIKRVAAIPRGNIVTVAKFGGRFTNIQSAIDSITDAAADNRYTVLVYEGVYELTDAIEIGSHITLRGVDRNTCILQGTASNKSIIKCEDVEDISIENLTVKMAVPQMEHSLPAISLGGRGASTGSSNILIQDCTIIGGAWCVEVGNSEDANCQADNVIIRDCWLNAPNPIYVVQGSNIDILNNTMRYRSELLGQCFSPADLIGAQDCRFVGNECHIRTESAPTDAYGIRLGSGCNVANNRLCIEVANAASHIVGISQPAPKAFISEMNANRVIDNTITMHVVSAGQTLTLVETVPFDVNLYEVLAALPDLFLLNNHIDITSAGVPTARYAINSRDEDEVTNELIHTIYTDALSIKDGYTGDWLDNSKAATIEMLYALDIGS